jgi:hypothetical protein
MLYAPMSDKGQWPLAWEKCELMSKHLNRTLFGYQLQIEKRMLCDAEHPEHRGSLVKWTVEDGMRKRDVLLETTDPKQMEAALFMLINEAEQAVKASNPSLVP